MKIFLKKLWNGIKTILARFKSPVVWAGIIAIVTIIFNTAGYQVSDLTSWKMVGDIFEKILSNPATIISILVAIFAYINNASDKKNF